MQLLIIFIALCSDETLEMEEQLPFSVSICVHFQLRLMNTVQMLAQACQRVCGNTLILGDTQNLTRECPEQSALADLFWSKGRIGLDILQRHLSIYPSIYLSFYQIFYNSLEIFKYELQKYFTVQKIYTLKVKYIIFKNPKF